MHRASDVLVIPRNLRWEVSARGVCRPMVDWFATKDRAIDHAVARAHEVDARAVVVETSDGEVDILIPVERRRAS